MARNVCVRCGEAVFVVLPPCSCGSATSQHMSGCTRLSQDNEPHLCRDIRRRLARRERQVAAVEAILWQARGSMLPVRDQAEAIVAKLANMGVTDDA